MARSSCASTPRFVNYDLTTLRNKRFYASNLELASPYVIARQREDGSWNLANLFKTAQPSPIPPRASLSST